MDYALALGSSDWILFYKEPTHSSQANITLRTDRKLFSAIYAIMNYTRLILPVWY